MHALVIHNSLNEAGGGDRLTVTTITVLKKLGFKVTLATCEATNWIKLKKVWGEDWVTLPDEEIYLFKKPLGTLGLYQRQLVNLRIHSTKGFDLIINTHGDLMPIRSNIIYMHFPTGLLATSPTTSKYSFSIFWRFYYEPYALLQKILKKLFLENSVILTNSEFTAEIIRNGYKVKPIIVYPPVDVSSFLKAFTAKKEREPIVISTGRFAPEKNYHLIPKIAKRVPEAKFYIIGTLLPRYRWYMEEIRKAAEKLNVRSRVKILANLPFQDLLAIYSRASSYLHLMRGEHFGISVVEAMAAGLVPIVNKIGGPWMDIIAKGKYGYGYLSIDRAVECVKRSLDVGISERKEISRSASRFSRKAFERRFTQIIRELGTSTPATALNLNGNHI